MTSLLTSRPRKTDRPHGSRISSMDNLKVMLVAGVIVGHVTMAWTGVGDWVFEETPVRDPLLSVLILIAVVGALFAIPLFFTVAGAFTPRSFERKGLRGFLAGRMLRLGVPMVFFVIFLSPIVEFVDPGNVGWTGGFVAFIPHVWWPPAPGPTWFLGVLLVFSAAYAWIRSVWPLKPTEPGPPRVWHLAVTAGLVAVISYLVRFAVPLGQEVWRLALGQAPAWVAGFTLGVLGAERGWFEQLDGRIGRIVRWSAWAGAAGCVLFIGAGAATGADIGLYAGGGTWQSMVIAVFEGMLVVAMSLWLVDVFRRRLDHQGPLGAKLSGAAYAAFVLHQVVLVGLVLASRQVSWSPELEYVSVAVLGVVLSFSLGAVVVKLPGLSRVI
jgi:fucose 4-O-acetylase-like acetyltransferase